MSGNKARFCFFVFTLLCTAAFAQERQYGAYMVPSKVYVGDRASLVLPLQGIAGNKEIDLIHIPSTPDIDIHRVALERRPGGSFLNIEFSAYTPGILELPPFDIAGKIFSGLTIEISSILESDGSGTVLSGPALPLAIPGTSLLIYGAVSFGILLMLLTIWLLFRGRAQMESWLAAWKRWWLLVSMLYTERRLRKTLAKGAACREILDVLSIEFRNFLACFTGENCRSMTAVEMSHIKDTIPDSEFLGGFFGRCDGIRFSGGEISGDETLELLGDLRSFLGVLGRAMRKKAAWGRPAQENPAQESPA